VPIAGSSKFLAKDVILLGEVAARGAAMLELRCGRCERRGRLSVQRLLAEYGADASVRRAMQAQIGDCPNRDHSQLQSRCDPYCPGLARLFGVTSLPR